MEASGQESEMCACGKPLHYHDPVLEGIIRSMVDKYGPTVIVTVPYGNGFKRSWHVPRHYIALHGLRGEDLPTLGFQEATDEK